MTIKEYSPGQFDLLEKDWRTLERGDDMSVFQNYDWFRNVNALFFQEHTKNMFRKWTYVVAYDAERAVMIAPIQVIKVGFFWHGIGAGRAFMFIGRQGYSDYLNFIYNDFVPEAFEAIILYLSKAYHLRKFYFEQLLESTQLYKHIITRYQVNKWEQYCAALTLPDSFEEYKQLLSKNTRQNIRTALNRQKRDEIHLSHEMIFQLSDQDADKLMQIRALRLKQKQQKSLNGASWKGKVLNRARFWIRKRIDAPHDVIRQCCNPWCFLVKDGERIASYFWGICDPEKGAYYVILAGVDPDYAWYSPSLSHLFLFLQERYGANDKTIKILDFTRGGERYKEDMGAHKKTAFTVEFAV